MKQPPKFPLLLLRLIAGRQIFEEIEGDLYEEYLDNVDLLGQKKARQIYIWTAFQSIRPYIFIHNKENRNPKFIDMIRYHLKMALRNIAKKKAFAAINILGLTVGIASSLAILLFIVDQAQVDKFHTNKDRIYRLESIFQQSGSVIRTAEHHGSLMSAIEDNIPGIESYVRLSKSNLTLVNYQSGVKNLIDEEFLLTDPDFFKVFSFKLLQGEPEEVLADPNGVVITESAAQRYFKGDNPIGKLIEFGKASKEPKTVTGVVADPGGNSSIQFSFVASNQKTHPPGGSYSFKENFSVSLPVYVLLDKGINPKTISSRIAPELKKHTNKKSIINSNYTLQPFDELKSDTDISDDVIAPVDKRLIFMFTIIAIFIIALAVINYVNLTSARSIQRTLEVSIRKVVGAGKRTLMAQFLTESFLVCFVSLGLSVLLLQLIIPYFEFILDRQLTYNYINFSFIALIILITSGIAVLAGIYPALILSGSKTNRLLNESFTNKVKGATLRKMLVVLQFTFSIALIIGAIFIQSQLNFIKNKTLGYSPDQIIVLNGKYGMFRNNQETIRTELLKIPGLTNVAMSDATPGGDFFSTMTSSNIPFPIVSYLVDDEFMEVFNLKISEGRNFSTKSDSTFGRILINQTLADALEIKSPLVESGKNRQIIDRAMVVGIMDDFHFESLYKDIRPALFRPAKAMPFALKKIIVKVDSDNFHRIITDIEDVWAGLFPDTLLDYHFLDDKLDRLYAAEYKLSKVFGVFTILAIFISCLGLFGLSMHVAQVKVKEISIRKVLGASVTQIIGLLSKQVFILVGIAAIFAIPTAYYFVNQWLQDFAYSVGISAGIFIVTIFFCLVLASITTGWHTLKTAYTNPAETLRSE